MLRRRRLGIAPNEPVARVRGMPSDRLWTFGHSTRTVEQTLELLRDSGIASVVDVRSIPGSRRNPQFGAEVMSGWLADAGIDYRRIQALGGRRRRRGVDPEINAGWTNDGFHAYADWTLGDEFEQGLAELANLVGSAGRPDRTVPRCPTAPVTRAGLSGRGIRTAIMCAEAVPWRCHRSLIATALVARGWQVQHVLGPGQLVGHRIGQWGPPPLLRPDGHVTYPRQGTPPLFD